MGRLVELVTPLHRRTARDYVGRMTDDKAACMRVARQYGRDYWDGARRYGYGGYRYDGRWRPVAQQLVDLYGLGPDARILDVGCGKGYLLYELSQVLPGATTVGFDVSDYAIREAKPEVRGRLFVGRAEAPFPFADGAFDLVVSLGTLHNLPVDALVRALAQVERVGRDKYVLVESYRNAQELFNLQCWALTCESFFRPREWTWLFDKAGYTGDYEFIFFE